MIKHCLYSYVVLQFYCICQIAYVLAEQAGKFQYAPASDNGKYVFYSEGCIELCMANWAAFQLLYVSNVGLVIFGEWWEVSKEGVGGIPIQVG